MLPNFPDNARSDDKVKMALENSLAASPIFYVRLDYLGRPLMSDERANAIRFTQGHIS